MFLLFLCEERNTYVTLFSVDQEVILKPVGGGNIKGTTSVPFHETNASLPINSLDVPVRNFSTSQAHTEFWIWGISTEVSSPHEQISYILDPGNEGLIATLHLTEHQELTLHRDLKLKPLQN